MVTQTEFAPIALFAFKRPEHMRRLLEDLQNNPEFLRSPLFIFCDGARNINEKSVVDQVRHLAHEFPHPNKTVVEAPQNQGLAVSIMKGVTKLCAQFGRVVVVEDDLAVSTTFLSYMNTALKRYADEPRVMQISGHMFPLDPKTTHDAVFMPVTTSWGWATWQRSWNYFEENPERALQRLKSRRWRHAFDLNGCFPNARMLSDRLRNRNNSWAIWWYFSVFENNGLVLFPTRSLVNNEGFDGSGTHCADKEIAHSVLEGSAVKNFPPVTGNTEAFKRYGWYLKRDRGFIKLSFDLLWRIFFITRFSHGS